MGNSACCDGITRDKLEFPEKKKQKPQSNSSAQKVDTTDQRKNTKLSDIELPKFQEEN